MTGTSTWRYDAAEHDPLTALRIPVIDTSHPDWPYLAAVCVDADTPAPLYGGQRPTDAEAAMIASFIEEYITRWYNPTWQHKMRTEGPFAIDSGAVGVVFLKYGDDDWAYRRVSWTQGPLFVPVPPNQRANYRARGDGGRWTERRTLVEVMDLAHAPDGDTPPESWTRWKAAHPEVFGRTTVRCTYANGDVVVTEINATFAQATAYFLGHTFNIGCGPDGNMQKCTSVELVTDTSRHQEGAPHE